MDDRCRYWEDVLREHGHGGKWIARLRRSIERLHWSQWKDGDGMEPVKMSLDELVELGGNVVSTFPRVGTGTMLSLTEALSDFYTEGRLYACGFGDYLPSYRRIKSIPYEKSAIFDCMVIEVGDDDFIALTRNAVEDDRHEMQGTFRLTDVHEEDRKLVQVGGRFFLMVATVGKMRLNIIKFTRQGWTQEEIDALKAPGEFDEFFRDAAT